MKKHLFKLFSLLAIAVIVITASCTKENADSKSVNLPVVESYLMPGKPVTVKVYQQKSITDTAAYGTAITGLKVYVSDGTNKVQLAESAAGTYTYADPAFLVAGKTYSLQFVYQDYTVSANTVMPSKPTNFTTQNTDVNISSYTGVGNMNTVLNVYSWSNPGSLNHVLIFECTNTAAPVRSFGNPPANLEVNTNQASTYNVTANIFSYYGSYNVVLLSVNQEYINLLKNNTTTSSQSLTQLPTNVVNGFGIFTAMQADTLGLQVNY